jgi:tubulin polyglutamylase TTLL6/13
MNNKLPVGFPMIVKPDQLSQGKGIFITNSIENIDLRELSVVQEYLNEPYLIDGLKFDMRIYVLVVSCDPLRIFIHKEGLVRFAT